MTGDEKGEWAKTADEGIVPDELSGEDESGPVGREAASDEPATEEGIDLAAGDDADATRDGGAEPPEGAEPDLKDAAAAAREKQQAERCPGAGPLLVASERGGRARARAPRRRGCRPRARGR